MRTISRIAFAVALPTFATAVFLAWRKALSNPATDITMLAVASVCGVFGFLLLALWLQERER